MPSLAFRYIYVAGPYTKPDPAANTRQAIIAGDLLRRLGLIPFIPHLTHFWDKVCPHPYQFWLDYDFEWVKMCEALVRLPGYSSGADKEICYAGTINQPVFFSVRELVTAAYATATPEERAEALKLVQEHCHLWGETWPTISAEPSAVLPA